ncbi:hypothetical protein [Nocardioides bruguierae]|uniref:Uncharacterized protein n=1 Tax=Nocardioides bruguierae TaxID=2945102 RepID=A0A9X2IGY6_9ACTN|nr:hypothetical protein [Nocardioides bruguierae]MCM0622508.1 hypothetical protein [Nocardioides bruguierae]
MPWPFQHGRTATVTRYIRDDRTQSRTIAPDQPPPLLSCAWDPGTTSAVLGPGMSISSSPRLLAAYDADVDPATDEITVEGVAGVWQIDGEVQRHRNDLTARQACAEIHLTRKAGRA